MGPELRHYRLIRLRLELAERRGEERSGEERRPARSHYISHLAMLTLSRLTTHRQFGPHLEEKRTIKGVSVNYRHNQNM